jgi:hypothetical protein
MANSSTAPIMTCDTFPHHGGDLRNSTTTLTTAQVYRCAVD